MSSEQTRASLNRFDSDLVALEKKLADLAKKEADKTKHINDIQRSITKNTSASSLQLKMRQMDGYNRELVKIISDKADVNKKIADKRKSRANVAIKLQKEEMSEKKNNDKIQQSLLSEYQRKITDLSLQIKNGVSSASYPVHFYSQNDNTEYDVFISHASEDKENFADELNKVLESYSFKVWYDTQTISWGDSLRAKIDQGLRKSRYGIVIISKHYIQKGWTQYELDGLFQKEMTGGKTILPIWHDITKQEVFDFSPTLAGRKALNTAMFTTIEIADELKKLLNSGNSINATENDSEGSIYAH
jgi:hypothetical protein